MAKVQISVDDELLARIDDYADRHYMTRSGFFTQSANNFLLTDEVQKSIRTMALAMKAIAETGTVSEQTMLELEDFQKLASALGGVGETF